MSSSPEHASGNPSDSATEKAAAIELLYRRFRVPLARFFEKRIGKQPEIDDLVQEVFLHLAGHSRIGSVDRPEAYMFRTAANVLHDRHRRQSARASGAHEPYEESVHGAAQESLTPERAALCAQELTQLVEALYELTARTRTVWALYHLEDLSHAEIGKRLGITVSMIEKHVARATAHLLKRFERSV